MTIVRNLIIGDPHVTPGELDDCEALMQLVAKVTAVANPDWITFTGDLGNNHDVLSVRTVEFWQRWLTKLPGRKILLRGNHDQSNPVDAFPHGLVAYSSIPNVEVVHEPTYLGDGVVAMGYYYDPAKFLADARQNYSGVKQTLLCHQTFSGSRYENGFYAKDAVNPDDVPFQTIISGHIHHAQKVGKVVYVGSPRWRIETDAASDKYLWLMEHENGHTKYLDRFPTDTHCRRIRVFQDTPSLPAPIDSISPLQLAKDDIRVDVYGPPAHVLQRVEALRSMGVKRPRGFPDRVKRTQVSEAEGIDAAFVKYLAAFKPPHGTEPIHLKASLKQRIGLDA